MDFRTLNSATKYPSILAYHQPQPEHRGKLEATPCVDFRGREVILTEKVDGTNGRMIILPGGDWFIGSREDLITARGDRVPNQGPVNLAMARALVPAAEQAAAAWDGKDALVIWAEVYGAATAAGWQNYSTDKHTVGARIFDVALVDPHILTQTPAAAAAWRDAGGQQFAPLDLKMDLPLERVPQLGVVNGNDIPTDIEGAHAWLTSVLTETQVRLDGTGKGQAEGIVIRTAGRDRIAKLRHPDYQKHARIQENATRQRR